MSWEDRSSRRNIPFLRHLGAGVTVYPWLLRTVYQTAEMSKDVQIFQANFFINSTPGMAVSSSHQWGVSNWWAGHSSHCSYSFIDGSGGKPCLSLVSQPVMGSSKKYSNSGLRVGRGPRSHSSTSPLVKCPQGSLWASHQRMCPPQAHERLHVSSAYVALGTGHASPGVYPKSS